MNWMIWLAAPAALTLAACQQDEPRDGGHPSTLPPPPPAASEPGLVASGPATPLEVDAQDDLQWAASVVAMDELPAQPGSTVKLFGAAGGDPAMNGLQTFLAFYVSPADGWRVFRVGDFLGYRVIGEAPGRVDLEIDESTYDEAADEIGSRTRRVILSWTATEGEAPEAVAMAEAG